MVASDEQTHVPFIAWLSDSYTREYGSTGNALSRIMTIPILMPTCFIPCWDRST
jgi:hypothetical protein